MESEIDSGIFFSVVVYHNQVYASRRDSNEIRTYRFADAWSLANNYPQSTLEKDLATLSIHDNQVSSGV